MNWLRTTLLLTGLTLLFIFIGKAIGGNTGMIIALGFAIAMNFSAYWYSDKLVLRAYQAQEVTSAQAPELFDIVRKLAHKAQIPMPKVYIVENAAPNAFATGRNPEHAAIAATTGLLKTLNRDELEGVLAHELSHVYNRDTLTGSIAATIAGAIATLANIGQFGLLFGREDHGGAGSALLAIILAPIAASLIQLGVSRTREYAADKRGADISGKPLALASALKKLQIASQQMPMLAAERHPNTAHLFIVNPLVGKKLRHLFSTHPSTEERIKRLEAMARQGR